MPTSISLPKVLLVEGKDEVKFFGAFLAHLNIVGVQPIEVGGKDKFPIEFPTLTKDPNFRIVNTVAIIRDADQNVKAVFDSVSYLLNQHKFPVPSAIGEIATSSKMKVGVFVMPGNKETGMLEDLCMKTVSSHPATQCVDSFMGCLSRVLVPNSTPSIKESAKHYFPKVPAKAKAQAFLAAMHEIVPSVGIAAEKGYWDFEHVALSELKSFLTSLYI